MIDSSYLAYHARQNRMENLRIAIYAFVIGCFLFGVAATLFYAYHRPPVVEDMPTGRSLGDAAINWCKTHDHLPDSWGGKSCKP